MDNSVIYEETNKEGNISEIIEGNHLPKFFDIEDKQAHNSLNVSWDAKISQRSSSARSKILRPQSGAGIIMLMSYFNYFIRS